MSESTPPLGDDPVKSQLAAARIALGLALITTPFLCRGSMLLTGGILLASLLLTARWWLRWAYIPTPASPPRIGRPTSKLSIAFCVIAVLLGTYLRLRMVGSTSQFTSILQWSLPAGIASIILSWRLLHWFGFRCAGLFAGFFVAIHPACIHYDTIASGHSLSLFLQLLSTASVYLALRTLKWRYWILFGLSIALCIHSHFGAIFFLITLTICLCAYLLRRILAPKTRAAATPLLTRFAVVTTVSLLLTYQASEPVQLTEAASLQSHDSTAISNARVATNSWYHVIAGSPIVTNDTNPALPILILSPLLAILGTVKVIQGNRYTSPMILGGIAAPLLAYAACRDHLPLAEWDLSFALPTFMIVFSVGITSLSDFIPKKSIRPLVTLGLGAAYLVLFSVLTPSTRPTSAETSPTDLPEKLDKQLAPQR